MKAGKRMKVLGNMAHHNIALGTIVRVTHTQGAGGQIYAYTKEFGMNKAFLPQDLGEAEYDKEELLNEIRIFQTKAKIAQSKLDYLTETKKEKLDDEDFRKHHLKKLVDDQTLSEKDRVERIEALMGDD